VKYYYGACLFFIDFVEPESSLLVINGLSIY